ncbi:hypothetical protein PAHAL_1G212200 [Panicum hallii]|jgi:hypothetical protein|uniref:Uncharacterized protein n=1 Tax=Panicum hallii TaxID=206008 RepID=A0A2S3GP60_9POAL|nr:hypothetical protein PAHAL_1G212200 [Panicum hallii]PAN05821.1 hypothetical protein PAHAL_1G212200 [Panicum hallii]PAN05822.1 hypothetical protein PAHAL_1G212200 [Panicum hallii]PAN05823.1 hypothetical protein PAHAL_1G212200 [Panicum hallii]PAN05824.1 hypothetical protein PAHAL_1G212200 [Panicum hallii]
MRTPPPFEFRRLRKKMLKEEPVRSVGVVAAVEGTTVNPLESALYRVADIFEASPGRPPTGSERIDGSPTACGSSPGPPRISVPLGSTAEACPLRISISITLPMALRPESLSVQNPSPRPPSPWRDHLVPRIRNSGPARHCMLGKEKKKKVAVVS